MANIKKEVRIKNKMDNLIARINQHNIVQGVKKQELGLLPNIWSANNAGAYRQRFYALQGNETGLDQISREQVVRLSRELFFQLPGVGVASELKSEYTIGNEWDFICHSKNLKWKAEVEDFINNQWYEHCSTRGFAFDFKTILKVISRTLDMDGDILMIFVRDKNNYPLLQFIGSHRIGSTSSPLSANTGTEIEYKGKNYKCLDGIVYDETDTPIAY
jgi:hypothetical protein